MLTLKATLTPKSAFGTTPKGDTLFGQLCWVIRNRFGETRLNDLLTGYTDGRPFAVVSDALPAGYLPRPALPTNWFDIAADADRKAVKKRAWLPLGDFAHPVAAWLAHCRSATDVPGGSVQVHPQPHNSIDRISNTTGNSFDPYSMEQRWYGAPPKGGEETSPPPRLDIIAVLDETRFSAEDLRTILEDMGALGFGRDASIGLGKFEIVEFAAFDLPAQPDADAWLTLAPCAPQGQAWDDARCFYQPFTRFGRHGDIGVHLGNPFKSPVLLADTGAVLSPRPTPSPQSSPASRRGDEREKQLLIPAGKGVKGGSFTGQGLGGDGSLSKSLPQTVHQGYAPVVGIKLPEGENSK